MFPPTNPLAVLKRLIGLLPSVMMNPVRPRAPSNSAYYFGPASAIETMVS